MELITTFDIIEAIQHLCYVLKHAVDLSYTGKHQAKKSKSGIRHLTEEIKIHLNDKKKAFWEWKEAGRPEASHPLSIRKSKTKSKFRKVQRLEAATKRQHLYSQIMASSKEDTKMFHKLIQKQRNNHQLNTSEIYWNDSSLTTSDEIRQGFFQYFQALAKPDDDPSFDVIHKKQVELDFLIIQDITSKDENQTVTITIEDVTKAVSGLNRGKAPDIMGIGAEHFQYAGDIVISYLFYIFKRMIEKKLVPEEIKEGLLTPILKKNKNPTDPMSYRGITVLVTIEKLFEKIWLTKGKPFIEKNQNKMQRGFTENSSCLNTAFLYSESINESKEKKEPVYVVTLDGQRAFDTVWIRSLLRNIYVDGIPNHLWALLDQLYSDVSTKVKWNNIPSESFDMLQGVRQGGILSAPLYKNFNNKLLDTLQEQSIGASIGPIYIPAPTCADDICCITNSAIDLQTCLYIVETFVNMERAKINNSKSDILKYNAPDIKINSWEICNSKIEETNSTVHLGITRNTNDKIDIESLIRCGRQTLYSLFGSGMHGRNGLNPIISKHIWSTYIIPRLTYGLEIVNITDKQIQQINSFQLKSLKQLQWLPDRCANVAVYLLVGAEPMEALIDKKVLTFFGQIIRDQNSLEYQIAMRQIAIYDLNSKSWFSRLKSTLAKYNLPSATKLMLEPPKKGIWKTICTKAVNKYWMDKFSEEKNSKSSLKLLSIKQLDIGKAHPIWKTIRPSPKDVEKASIKARILTGTYTLQANRAKFNQYEIDPTCPLCKDGAEDRLHFLLLCKATEEARIKFLSKLINLAREHLPEVDIQMKEILLQLIVDSSDIIENNLELISEFESLGRELIFSIHCCHTKLMASLG